MTWFRVAIVGTLATVALAGSACSSGGTTSPTILQAPAPPPTTETFTGTVPVGGGDIHTFMAAAGPLSITLTEAGPPPTIFMGLGIGTPADTACTFFSGAVVSAQASQTAQIAGTLSSGGSICVETFDIGNQAAPITYSMTVTHS